MDNALTVNVVNTLIVPTVFDVDAGRFFAEIRDLLESTLKLAP